MKNGFAAGFSFLFFDDFLAQFSFCGEGSAVDHAERLFVVLVFFVFGVGQVNFLRSCVSGNLSILALVLGSRTG
jgi:hypothetical protein